MSLPEFKTHKEKAEGEEGLARGAHEELLRWGDGISSGLPLWATRKHKADHKESTTPEHKGAAGSEHKESRRAEAVQRPQGKHKGEVASTKGPRGWPKLAPCPAFLCFLVLSGAFSCFLVVSCGLLVSAPLVLRGCAPALCFSPGQPCAFFVTHRGGPELMPSPHLRNSSTLPTSRQRLTSSRFRGLLSSSSSSAA